MCERAESQLLAARNVEAAELWYRGDVDDMTRTLHVQLHQIDQCRAAGEKTGVAVTQLHHGLDGFTRRRRPRISEVAHAQRLCPATSWIAARMPTYAPQRQRLPLIYSRISSGVPVWPSLTQAIADMI